MSKAKEGTNDQEHIIDALRDGNYAYVWEQVKYIGYQKVADINDRYIIFCDIVESFDYERNNNFICFYSTRLGFINSDICDTFFVTHNKSIINKLKSEYISPTECENSKITRDLKKWTN